MLNTWIFSIPTANERRFCGRFFILGALMATQFAVIYLEGKLVLRLITLGAQT